jgi:quinol monooxygenase YgiN
VVASERVDRRIEIRGSDMSVLVLLEAPVKSEKVSSMKSFLEEILPETRAYKGCQAIDMYFNTEDAGKMVLVEHWDSRPNHEKYLGWRTETGVMEKIGAMLAGPPTIRYFERAGA